jgi:hypothetical protein
LGWAVVPVAVSLPPRLGAGDFSLCVLFRFAVINIQQQQKNSEPNKKSNGTAGDLAGEGYGEGERDQHPASSSR